MSPRRRAGTSMMRFLKTFGLYSLAAIVLPIGLGFAGPAHAEKRVALVIGNNDYRNVPKLQKAVNDARAMGDALKQLGFSVMVAENLNRQQFSQALLTFDNAVEPGDTAFFFYAGHGFEIAGQNFLLPTDVPAATEGRRSWCAMPPCSPTASSSGCRTRRRAPRSWCLTPAATIRSSGPAPARSPAAAGWRR